MERALLPIFAAVLLGLPSSRVAAAEPGGPVEASDEPSPRASPEAAHEPVADATTDLPPAAGDRTDQPWLRRWGPERSMAELGLYGGVLLTSRRSELFEADVGLPDQGYRPLASVAPDLGLRLGYFSTPWLGVESEAGLMPTRAEPRGRALLWTVRGSVVGQLATRRKQWSVTPFVLVGGGVLGVSSERDVVGDDVDASFHVGGGVKVYVNRHAALRIDVRDVVGARRGYKQGVSNSPEILLGMTVTLGRLRNAPPRRQPHTDDGPGPGPGPEPDPEPDLELDPEPDPEPHTGTDIGTQTDSSSH